MKTILKHRVYDNEQSVRIMFFKAVRRKKVTGWRASAGSIVDVPVTTWVVRAVAERPTGEQVTATSDPQALYSVAFQQCIARLFKNGIPGGGSDAEG